MGWKFWQPNRNKDNSWNWQEDEIEEEVARHKRELELRKAMGQLVKEHMVISTINDWYILIRVYIQCKDKKEYDYCKHILETYSKRAYESYDIDRL